MYTVQNYVKVKSLEEAYELNQKKSSKIIGGGMWLRLGKRSVGTMIDLTDLGLDQIEETDESFIIGCMTSLRAIESHEGLNVYFNGMMKETMKGIVGTQFRNTATIGGSIYQRFGFSDPLTALLALDTTVEMYHGGMIPLDDFVCKNYDRDLLVRIHIKKNGRKISYQSFRHTKTDFPVLTVAVSRLDGQWKVAIGARPMKARLADPVIQLKNDAEDAEVEEFAEKVSKTVNYGSNMRSSAEYRQVLAEVLIARAAKEILAEQKSE